MRLENPEKYLGPSGRAYNVGVGLAAGLIAVTFLGLGVFVVVRGAMMGIFDPSQMDRGSFEFLVVPAILFAIGIPGAWVAFRLLSGRPRRDGGLMSPALLRVGSTLLGLSGWFLLVLKPLDAWRWFHAVTGTTAGIAGWMLAARRERRDALDTTVSTPTNKPIG